MALVFDKCRKRSKYNIRSKITFSAPFFTKYFQFIYGADGSLINYASSILLVVNDDHIWAIVIHMHFL